MPWLHGACAAPGRRGEAVVVRAEGGAEHVARPEAAEPGGIIRPAVLFEESGSFRLRLETVDGLVMDLLGIRAHGDAKVQLSDAQIARHGGLWPECPLEALRDGKWAREAA